MSFVDPSIQQIDVNLSSNDAGVQNLAKTVLRGSVILNRPMDFNVSVSKLICPINYSVPLLIPVLNLASQDAYETIYSVTLEYDGYYSDQTFLQIIPTNTAVAPTTFTAQPTNLWGSVYNFQTIWKMVNTALATAFADLQAQVAALEGLEPPYFTWNASTSLATLNCFPMSVYNSTNSSNLPTVNLFYNNVASMFFQGLDVVRITTEITALGRECQVLLENTGNNWIFNNGTSWVYPPGYPLLSEPTSEGTSVLLLTQQYPTTYVFQAMASILVVTSLPIVSAYTDVPISSMASGANNAQLSILTSFSIDYSTMSSEFNSPITYVPTSIINSQPVNMTGNQEISSFTVALYWQACDGNIYPLQTICPNQNAYLRLAFTRKRFLEK